MGGEELKWRQLAHRQLMSQQRPHFRTHSNAKANYKSTNLRKLVTNAISDVAITSVHSEKNRLKKMIMIKNFFEYIARNDVFLRVPEIDFRYETKVRNVMVDFKFDALYR